MGYNAKDYIKVRDEFSNKYRIARQRSDERRAEIHALIPEIFDIDRTLSRTGMDIMAVITSGVKDTDAEIAKLQARNDALIAQREQLLVRYGYPEGYTDVHYDCDKCGDTGYVENAMCECMKRALIKAGYESSGLGSLIGKQTFENFEYSYYSEQNGERERVKRAVSALREFAEGFDGKNYRNFLIIGAPGLGKTHLSTAVAQKVIEKGFDTLYVSAVSMMGDFQENRFGNGSVSSQTNDVERYYDCDLLIIDDLGTEVVNKFTQSYFYEVINTRINSGKCTIINTNLGVQEINTTYTERIASRLLGEYRPILFKGVDIRKQKSLR
jgi:DNA replication protein DnaC